MPLADSVAVYRSPGSLLPLEPAEKNVALSLPAPAGGEGEIQRSFFQSNPKNSFARVESRFAPRPWDVARVGRLLAGAGVLVVKLLGLQHHPGWLLGTLAVALNLVLTALTDHCVMRNLLLRLGAKEREDLFLPGGAVRGSQGPCSDRRASFERTPVC